MDSLLSYFFEQTKEVKVAFDNKNFVKWFGDSKLINNGTPMELYHYTPNKFNEFRVNSELG